MKLYIPEIGDILTLSNEWTATIRNESRNHVLLAKLGYVTSWNKGMYLKDDHRHVVSSTTLTFEKGDQLKVDRIYVRKGAAEYSSISFIIHKAKSKIKGRFWVKLDEANSLEFDRDVVEKSIKLKWGYPRGASYGLINIEHMYGQQIEAWKTPHTIKGKVIEGQTQGTERFEIIHNVIMRDVTQEEVDGYNERMKSPGWRSTMLHVKKKIKHFIYIEKNEFTLIDLDGNMNIGTWKTIDTAKSNARKILKKENALK